MKEKKTKVVKFTDGIPLCPYCKKPTIRNGANFFTRTAMNFSPIYNEYGKNINPDRNIRTFSWHCQNCHKSYITKGNSSDGYFYN